MFSPCVVSRNSLIILDNENLDRIWVHPKQSVLTIATGGIDISMNRKLCQQYIDAFLRNVSFGTGASAVMWRPDAGAAWNDSSRARTTSSPFSTPSPTLSPLWMDGNWSYSRDSNASSSSFSSTSAPGSSAPQQPKVVYLGNGDKATCNVLLVRLEATETGIASTDIGLRWSTDHHDTHHVHGWVLYWRTAPDNRTFTIYRYVTYSFPLCSSLLPVLNALTSFSHHCTQSGGNPRSPVL